MTIDNLKINYKTKDTITVRKNDITGAVDIQLTFKVIHFSEKWYYNYLIIKLNKSIEAILKRFLALYSENKYIVLQSPVKWLKYDFYDIQL